MTTDNQPIAFSCDRAAELLDHPTSTVKDCKELLPRLWRVVLVGGDFAPRWNEVRSFLWREGAVVQPRGQTTFAGYLRELDAHKRTEMDLFALTVLLEVTQALPPGFGAGALEGRVGDLAGGVRFEPFGLTLVQRGYAPPPKVIPGAPTPPSNTTPPGGPATPAGPPPGAAAPGGPAPAAAMPGGPAPGAPMGGPPGGPSPPITAKATLTLDAQYRGEWVVEVSRAPGHPYAVVERIPVAP